MICYLSSGSSISIMTRPKYVLLLISCAFIFPPDRRTVCDNPGTAGAFPFFTFSASSRTASIATRALKSSSSCMVLPSGIHRYTIEKVDRTYVVGSPIYCPTCLRWSRFNLRSGWRRRGRFATDCNGYFLVSKNFPAISSE